MVRIARELNRDVATGSDAHRIYQTGTFWDDAAQALSRLGMVPNRKPDQRGVPLRRVA